MPALAVVARPTDPGTEDRDLIAGVRAGDDRCFELLFHRYQPRIAAYVRRMVHDHGRAEDITQEVFMSALRRMRETDREISFKPWIYEIAKNACIDAFRRGRSASEVSFDAHDAIGADEHGRLAEPGATPDSAVEGKAAIDNLCGAFGGLSPVHHDILVLRELEGRSYREIGDRLGMSRPAVESTLFRARKRLSEEYEELVSGERCLRIQRIVDASDGGAAGLRDQRRMARHLAHCQPCRRYAARSGMDLGQARRPAAAAAARIAAFLPLPAFLRKRWSADQVSPLLGHGGSPVTQWSANVATALDPGVASGWAKTVATAATVAVASVGAGAAIKDRTPRFVQPEPTRAPLTQTPTLGRFGHGSQAAVEASRPAAGRASAHTRPSLLGRPAMSSLQQPAIGAAAPAAPAGVPPAASAPAGAPQPGRPARDLDPAARIPAVLGARSAAVDGGGEAPAGAIARVLETVGQIGRGTQAAAGGHAAIAAKAAAAADGRPDVARAVAAALLERIAAAVTDAVSAANQAVTTTVKPAAEEVRAAAPPATATEAPAVAATEAPAAPAATAVSDSVSSTVSDTITTTTTPALTSLGG
jgi:RNA polymerase sigma factor (sigma-70 family)